MDEKSNDQFFHDTEKCRLLENYSSLRRALNDCEAEFSIHKLIGVVVIKCASSARILAIRPLATATSKRFGFPMMLHGTHSKSLQWQVSSLLSSAEETDFPVLKMLLLGVVSG